VFFDKLKIEWEYEQEGFIMKDGTRYLPDFYLPTFEQGMFVEVKGIFTQEEKELCRDLCYESGKNVLLAEGIPSTREYQYLVKDNTNDCVHYFLGLPNANKAEHENRMFANSGLSDFFTFKIKDENLSQLNIEYLKSIRDARSARFEHGESGSFPK
jgi:hypothetical protein